MSIIIKINPSSRILCIILFFIILPFFNRNILLSANDSMLEEWQAFSQNNILKKQFIEWLKCKAMANITGTDCTQRFNVAAPPYFGKLGIFITLKKGKNVRGCYGAFSHSSADIAAVLSDYLSGALTRDPRYKPLDISELESTDIILTITSQPYAVADAESIDMHRYGIAITCTDGLTTVYVPAEVRNSLIIQRALKGKDCQIYAFKAITIK